MLTTHQQVQEDARELGRRDRTNNRPCDPSKYDALEHSAWALWYRQGYFEQEEAEQ